MAKGKRILICPLDWGLGHATRCIPIIRLLEQKGAEVIIAADKRPAELLKKEFPHLKHILLKGYEIQYPKKGSMIWAMLRSIPKIIKGIRTEHKDLSEIIKKHEIDIVISDNRYGCWNANTKNLFITHQLMIKSPFGENILHRIVSKYIDQFDECWVPDNEKEPNLSGDLSHKYPGTEKTFFIGPLTRFKADRDQQQAEYDVMAIISGPEPQRTLFERIVSEQLFKSGLRSLIVFGLPERTKKVEQKGNVTMISHLSSDEMEQMIDRSNLIIARSGYSTILDLSALQKKVIFIPTPGQTEQEYLAKELFRKNIAYYQKQSEFDLKKAIKESERFKGFAKLEKSSILIERIDFILS